MRAPLIGLALLVIPGLAAADSPITVSEPFARAGSKMAQAGAAFMTITNSGASDRLVAARSDVAKVIELHTHVEDAGMMRMREVEFIDLPGGADTVLAPGGLHVMLIGLNRPLNEGETLSLTLDFAEAPDQVIEVPIRGPGAMAHGHNHGHDHGHKHGHEHGHNH